MSKPEQRVMIHFFLLKGRQPQEIQKELIDVCPEQAFQLPAVEKQHLRFADKRAGR
jgi:hypothetical protein